MFPVVVEVGEMAGGGGVAEVEILMEVQALLYLLARFSGILPPSS